MVELYPNDFVDVPEVVIRHQLRTYVRDVRQNTNFANLKRLSDLCAKLVETNKCNTYDLVYKILKLALGLSVATASMECVFSAMNLVKSQLRNKMSDQWLNDCLITLLERDVLATIDNDIILANF
ncbi:zinc finger MYM-type protein [Trifolium repens]|nr:zinc finger MYM-type protein [Trifolium repens]